MSQARRPLLKRLNPVTKPAPVYYNSRAYRAQQAAKKLDAYKQAYGDGKAPQQGSNLSSRIANKIVGAYSGQAVDDSKSFKGEHHGILTLPDGRKARANFMGPGTQILARLKRGDVGRTPVDVAAKRHDIDYSLAQTPADVVAADNLFINRVNDIAKRKADHPKNIAQAHTMRIKRHAEKVLGANALKFSSQGAGWTPRDRALLLLLQNRA